MLLLRVFLFCLPKLILMQIHSRSLFLPVSACCHRGHMPSLESKTKWWMWNATKPIWWGREIESYEMDTTKTRYMSIHIYILCNVLYYNIGEFELNFRGGQHVFNFFMTAKMTVLYTILNTYAYIVCEFIKIVIWLPIVGCFAYLLTLQCL